LWDDAELYIAGVERTEFKDGVSVFSYSGTAARAALSPAGDGLGRVLEIHIGAQNRLEKYDAREIVVQYTYSGVSTDTLRCFHEAYSGYRAISRYKEAMVNSLWNTGAHSAGLFFSAC